MTKAANTYRSDLRTSVALALEDYAEGEVSAKEALAVIRAEFEYFESNDVGENSPALAAAWDRGLSDAQVAALRHEPEPSNPYRMSGPEGAVSCDATARKAALLEAADFIENPVLAGLDTYTLRQAALALRLGFLDR